MTQKKNPDGQTGPIEAPVIYSTERWRIMSPLENKNSPLARQHKLGVELLQRLGLSYVSLERTTGGHNVYHAWDPPVIGGNGGRTSKRGTVRTRVG